MKTRLFAFALAIVTTFAFMPAVNVANATPNKIAYADAKRVTALPIAQITGSATNLLGQLVNFTGTFTPTRFITRNGQLLAVGILTGTLTNTVTGVVQTVNQIAQIPVTNASGTCTILHLTLGPLDLNLLGLLVHLDRVVLNIDAQPGGGLLGDLLCSIANLLNGGSPLTALSGILNRILGILGGI